MIRHSFKLPTGVLELDPCGSPKKNKTSVVTLSGEKKRECRCYYGPQSFPFNFFVPKWEQEEQDEHLTPLEMPDGSTRLTGNWLPVDPVAGFTFDTNPLYELEKLSARQAYCCR
jgi:hypothetical protein